MFEEAPQNGALVPHIAEGEMRQLAVVEHIMPENFRRLRRVMEKLWFGRFCKRDLRTMSHVEESVLKAVIASKAPAENLGDAFADKADAVVRKCSKRLEEKRKFVVKRVVKKMVDRFHRLDKGSRRNGKVGNHLHFLRKYFGGAARRKGIAIEGFLLPDVRVKHPDKLNVISEEYFRRLRMSPQFVADFCATMSELYEGELQGEIRRKLKNFVDMLYPSCAEDETLEALKRSLGSKKAKQPWTMFEVKDACRTVRKSLLN